MAMGVNLLDTIGNVIKKITGHTAADQCSLHGIASACSTWPPARQPPSRLATRGLDVHAREGALHRRVQGPDHRRPQKAQCRWGDVWYNQVAMVLTLGSNGGGRWKKRGSPEVMVRRWHGNMAVVRGVAYFPRESCQHGHESEEHVITGFDLDTEAWQPLGWHGPPVREADGHAAVDHTDRSLSEVNGFLVAAHRDKGASVVRLWFWMNVDVENCKWFALYKIPMAGLEGVRSFEKPLRVLDDGRVVVWSSMDGSRDGAPQIYDPSTETFAQGAVTANCYAVGAYTGCLLRVGRSSELLDAGTSHGLSRTIEYAYGRCRHAAVRRH
uniref:F-box associated domain-containing protein n=1 Tax=Aegilops tauschii TaxID=37682 RepID=M8ASH7_AEGTA